MVLILALLAIAMLARNRAEAQETDPGKADAIQGMVINRVTHAPIPRALVSSSDQRFGTLTDSEGRFEFAAPTSSTAAENGIAAAPNASTFLLARKPGFLTDSPVRNYSAGKEITLALVPEAIITGKVTLPNAEPPDSIPLELYRRQVEDGTAHWVLAAGTQSHADGEFRFAELSAGTYKLLTRELMDRDPFSFDPQGQLYGYPPVYAQNAPDFSSASEISVAAGSTNVANLSVSRKAYYRVHIPVSNAQGLGGLNITVYAGEHREPGFSLGYNRNTQSIEGMLPTGNYTIEAFGPTAQGVGMGVMAFSVKGAAVAGPGLALVPNGSIKVVVNEEFTSVESSGTTTFINGRRSFKPKGPLSYLNMTLEPVDDGRGGSPSLRQPSGPGDETLLIENAQPGRYWVRVNSTRGYAASVRSGSVDLLHDPIVIAPGGSTPPIEITMRDDTATIDGTVEGIPAGAVPLLESMPGARPSMIQPIPAPPAYVYCIPRADSNGQFVEVWVSPDGSFASQPLAPGAYRVLAFDRPQGLEYRNPEAMQAYDGKGPVVRISGGQQEHVRLHVISSSE